MNIELGKQLAHQLLMDTPALNDKDYGIKGCPLCNQATWSQAGVIARRMEWEFSGDFEASGKTLPVFQDVIWPNASDIIESWDEVLRRVHARHAYRV